MSRPDAYGDLWLMVTDHENQWQTKTKTRHREETLEGQTSAPQAMSRQPLLVYGNNADIVNEVCARHTYVCSCVQPTSATACAAVRLNTLCARSEAV